MRKYTFLLLLIGFNAGATDSYGVGQRDYVLQDSARSRKLATHVWYPVDSGTQMSPAQANGPFLPVVAALNAPLAGTPPKRFPVVLLSHGSMGMAKRLFWLTEHLVRHGIVVLGVDHPGNRTGDSSAEGAVRQWDRAKDLSFALDRLVELPEFKSHLDLTRVAAAGHSAGGTTVLLLAGARFSASQFTNPSPKCSGTDDPYYSKQCEQLKAIDFKTYPRNVVEGNYTDPRVQAIVAFDPGFVRSFKAESLRKLKAKPLLFIAEKLAVPQDELYSKEFARYLPSISVETVPGSFHMTFMNACKPGLPPDDPELKELCAGNDQKLRIQKEVAEKSLAFFRNSWSD